MKAKKFQYNNWLYGSIISSKIIIIINYWSNIYKIPIIKLYEFHCILYYTIYSDKRRAESSHLYAT